MTATDHRRPCRRCGHDRDDHVDLVFGCKVAFEDANGDIVSFCPCPGYRAAGDEQPAAGRHGRWGVGMREQRAWCEDFDTVYGLGTDRGPHYVCRRCGQAYRWSGFRSLKVGPCIADRWPCLDSGR